MAKRLDLILCLLTALLLPVAFVVPYAGIISWFMLVPLFLAIEDKSSGDAFKFGLLAGTVANAIGSYWIIGTITRFGGFPFVVSFVFHLIFSFYSGLMIALFSYISVRLDLFRKAGLFSAVLIAAVWTSVEFFFPYLFPYSIANFQADYLPLIQIFDLFGIYALSFVIVLVNVALMRVVKRFLINSPMPNLEISASLIVLILVIGYGFWRINGVTGEMADAPKIRVGIVQGNFDFLQKQEENNDIITKTHKEMSRNLSSSDLIIWPETAIQTWFLDSTDSLSKDGVTFVPFIENTHFLVGGMSYGFKDGRPENPVKENIIQYNTAFLTTSTGEVLDKYHKIELLLFGEYLPFSGYFPSIKKLSPATGDFTPGVELEVFEIEEKGLRVAPLICYEDILPSFSRRFVEKGANLFVNITNDSWFGESFAAYQHMLLSVPTAVQTRRYLVRSTNTGISAIIDPVGRVVERTDLFKRTTLSGEVSVMGGGKTFYVRIGDIFPLACLGVWVGFAAIGILRDDNQQ